MLTHDDGRQPIAKGHLSDLGDGRVSVTRVKPVGLGYSRKRIYITKNEKKNSEKLRFLTLFGGGGCLPSTPGLSQEAI